MYWKSRKDPESGIRICHYEAVWSYATGMIEPETSFVKSGSVGGTPVRWFRASRHRGPEELEYRTFTLVDEKNDRYLAVSVYAASEAQMNDRLSVLERMKYR